MCAAIFIPTARFPNNSAFCARNSRSRHLRAAVFIVDKKGKIAFAKVYPLDQAPNNEELLTALKKILKS